MWNLTSANACDTVNIYILILVLINFRRPRVSNIIQLCKSFFFFVKASILRSNKLRPHSYSRPGRSPQDCVQTSRNIHEQTQVHTNRLMSSSTFFGQLRRAIFPGNLLPDLRRYCPVRDTERDIYHIYLISYNHIRSSYAMNAQIS